jgi:hypothetical protein
MYSAIRRDKLAIAPHSIFNFHDKNFLQVSDVCRKPIDALWAKTIAFEIQGEEKSMYSGSYKLFKISYL